MKKSRYTDSRILAILKQNEAGTPVSELCREHGMSDATFSKWRARYGGMNTSLTKRMNEPEDENRRLKKMYAEERINSEIRKDALGWQIVPIAQSDWWLYSRGAGYWGWLRFMIPNVLRAGILCSNDELDTAAGDQAGIHQARWPFPSLSTTCVVRAEKIGNDYYESTST